MPDSPSTTVGKNAVTSSTVTAPAAGDVPIPATGLDGLSAAETTRGQDTDDSESAPSDEITTQTITRQEAFAWWSIPPLLESEAELSFGMPKAVFLAKARTPYHQTDPREEAASLMVLYVDPDRDWQESDWAWSESGGIAVFVTSYPDSVPASLRPSADPRDGEEAVTVRGQPGRYSKMLKSEGANVDLSFVSWVDQASDTFLGWQVVADPTIYDRDALIEWANNLRARSEP